MFSKIIFFVVVFTILCSCLADNVNNKIDSNVVKKSLIKNCGESYSLTCLKLDAISWMDKLNENNDINILPGVSLVRENKSAKTHTGEMVAELAREFPDDPNARLNGFLMKKVYEFFGDYSLKLNLWNTAAVDAAGTARKKDKKGDSMGMLFAAAAMMKGLLLTLALGGLAAIAGKALMTALISFLLSAIVGLKGLNSGGGGGHSTYEVVAKPVQVHSHSHSTEGWDRGYEGHGRSLEDYPLPLALQQGYKLP